MELVNDDLGVAYPIVNGIPRLVPTEGRILQQEGGGGSGGDDAAATSSGGSGGAGGT